MPITIYINDEGPPKRQIIEMAFSEIGAAGYEFGRSPEEVADALGRLNAMMAEWKAMRGIDLGYNQPTYATGNPDELSGIPFETLNTVASYLALRVCPMMGATIGAEAKGNMARSLVLLEAHYANIPTMPRDRYTPIGAGNRHLYTGPYFHEDADELNPVPPVP